MAEIELRCNFKHCRKVLDGMCWVTSCSHVFCDEDGSNHFGRNSTCPSCETSLTGDSDLFRTNLKPSEPYRSMILAGQRPETITDIVSRALNFWNYQMNQEKMYHEWVAKKLQEQITSLHLQYQEMLTKLQVESESFKAKIVSLSKDLDETKRRYEDVAEKYNEKVRQYQTLSSNYESLKRKSSNIFAPSTQTASGHQHGTSNIFAPATNHNVGGGRLF